MKTEIQDWIKVVLINVYIRGIVRTMDNEFRKPIDNEEFMRVFISDLIKNEKEYIDYIYEEIKKEVVAETDH